jgi:hypothetical protein
VTNSTHPSEQAAQEIAAFLAGYPASMREISEFLSELMRQAMPLARETLDARHNHLGYALILSLSERICYICPMRDYVRLGFMYGASLPDPDRLLQGEGKRLRHVKIGSMSDAQNPAVRALVTAANAIGPK